RSTACRPITTLSDADRGVFEPLLDGALWLMRERVAPQVNALTCLTSVNRGSVSAMIRALNAQGLKNFFVTPVCIVEGARPSARLRVDAPQLVAFLNQLEETIPALEDARVEIGLFEVGDFAALLDWAPKRWAEMCLVRDALEWRRGADGNDYVIRYAPHSITGTREFVSYSTV